MPVASRVAAERGGGKGAEGKDKRHACMKSAVLERFTFEKGEMRGGGPRRPAQSERKNRAFSAKRQAVWFETQRVSNRNCSGMDGGGRDILREVALSRYRQGTGKMVFVVGGGLWSAFGPDREQVAIRRSKGQKNSGRSPAPPAVRGRGDAARTTGGMRQAVWCMARRTAATLPTMSSAPTSSETRAQHLAPCAATSAMLCSLMPPMATKGVSMLAATQSR